MQIARSGLSATLVNRNAIYDVPGLGPISTVQYEIRLSSGYNVFDMDSAFPDEQLGTFEFEGEEIVTQHFSHLFGFVQLSGVFVRFEREKKKIVPVGTATMKLLEFIPSTIE